MALRDFAPQMVPDEGTAGGPGPTTPPTYATDPNPPSTLGYIANVLGGALKDTLTAPLPRAITDEAGYTHYQGQEIPPQGRAATPGERLKGVADYASMGVYGRGGFNAPPLSKVMEGGKPKRVYRGTTAGYDVEDPTQWKAGGLYGPGGYYTESPEVAGGYSKASLIEQVPQLQSELEFWHQRVREAQTPMALDYARWRVKGYEDLLARAETHAPNVRASYLDITKPFDADTGTIAVKPLLKLVKESLRAAGQNPDPNLTRLRDRLTGFTLEDMTYEMVKDLVGGRWANNFLKRMGYDGITHIGGQISGGQPHRVWITFDPKQEYPSFTPKEQLP